ncbi:glycerol-3-phosphate 1-O-acyltransferase PlsY [Schlesneria paludicola]|uniref:glycerol-3-phosphate 1-O-acyltransferase PlsY n=1 Tax=Schlesneria paludicola TaxID=360056 RepID=UPI00029B4603|nr:glycerol-3-phosphate 1-O-acyltransferase PlsY [Schlesneria paludicola]
MVNMILLALLSYLAGSVPFGLIIGKVIKGIDLRNHGSGNIGATNAWRVLGKGWGLVCLLLDALKGLLPVAFFPPIFFAASDPQFPHAFVVAGIATIIGHMFPCWLGFRGGKGVATSLGVLMILSPYGVLLAAALFFVTLGIWRYVSLSSMIAAIGYGGYELCRHLPAPFGPTSWSQSIFAIMIPLLIIIRHRANIGRLLRGEESKLGSKRVSQQDAVTQATIVK